MTPRTCAPAERDVSGNRIEHVSLRGSEEQFGDRRFYKHFVPTGRQDFRVVKNEVMKASEQRFSPKRGKLLRKMLLKLSLSNQEIRV
jgi:hypothetical protein